jgi:hypothetical protein
MLSRTRGRRKTKNAPFAPPRRGGAQRKQGEAQEEGLADAYTFVIHLINIYLHLNYILYTLKKKKT